MSARKQLENFVAMLAKHGVPKLYETELSVILDAFEAEEREACAKLCDKHYWAHQQLDSFAAGRRSASSELAEDIRTRGTK